MLRDEHPETVISIYNTVKLHIALKEFAEARELAIECRQRNAAVFGKNHTETIDAIKLLIDLYTVWHEAEPDAGHDTSASEWRAKLNAAQDEAESDSDVTENQ